MSENSLRSVLERIREKCEQYWNEPNIGDAEIHAALECIHRDVRAALAATQEPQPQRDEKLLSLANAIWDVMGLGRSEQADIQRIFDVLDKRLPRAAGAPAASGRSPLLHEASTHKPPGCYCPPNDCQAPRIMGRQVPCSRSCDTYTEMCKPGSSVKLRYNCVLPKNHTKPHAFAGDAAAPRPELAPASLTKPLSEDYSGEEERLSLETSTDGITWRWLASFPRHFQYRITVDEK